MQKTILESALHPYLKLMQRNLELMKLFTAAPEIRPATPEESQNPFLALQSQFAQVTQSAELVHVARAALKNYTEFWLELGQTGTSVAAPAQQSLFQSQGSLAQLSQSVVETLASSVQKHERSEKSDKRKSNIEGQGTLQEA